MAEKDTAPFAVDADITPLQGRYFEYAQSQIRDPRTRQQAYGLIQKTFGGIQQARDIQRAKQMEDQNQALNLDIRRAQLDQGKLELAVARDKFRRQQESLSSSSAFYDSLKNIAQNKDTTPDQKEVIINEFGAENAGIISNDPVAANRFEYTEKSIKAQQEAQRKSKVSSQVIKGLVSVNATDEEFRQAGVDPNDSVVASMRRDVQQNSKEQKIKNVLEVFDSTFKPFSGKKEDEGPIDWGAVDEGLKHLDNLGVITEDDKKNLKDVGVRTFSPDAAPPVGWNTAKQKWPDTLVQKRDQIIRGVLRKASVGETKPNATFDANKAGGFNASKAGN